MSYFVPDSDFPIRTVSLCSRALPSRYNVSFSCSRLFPISLSAQPFSSHVDVGTRFLPSVQNLTIEADVFVPYTAICFRFPIVRP